MQEGRVDAAHQGHGPFNQTRNLGQQALVFNHLHAGGKGKVLRALPDGGLTLGAVEDDMSTFEFHDIIIKPRDGKAAGREEAVAFGGVGGGDAIDRQGDNAAAAFIGQDAQDGVQGAHPFQRAGPPAHGFGPWERADGGFQHLGNDVGSRTAGLFDNGVERFTLFVGAAFELIEREAGGAQEAFNRRSRSRGGGTFAFFAQGL